MITTRLLVIRDKAWYGSLVNSVAVAAVVIHLWTLDETSICVQFNPVWTSLLLLTAAQSRWTQLTARLNCICKYVSVYLNLFRAADGQGIGIPVQLALNNSHPNLHSFSAPPIAHHNRLQQTE